MIVVRIELHSARTGEVTELGKMLIANDGTSPNPKRGDYTVKLARRGVTDPDHSKTWNRPQRQARVEKYPRLSFSVWVLVARGLKALGIERFADFYEDQTDRALDEKGF